MTADDYDTTLEASSCDHMWQDTNNQIRTKTSAHLNHFIKSGLGNLMPLTE
jgi:hypothetical protein